MWSPLHCPPCIWEGGWNSTSCNVSIPNLIGDWTLIHPFSGMNGTVIWMMAWTLTTSARTGGTLCFGSNGRSMLGNASGQVWNAFLNMYDSLIKDTDNDQTVAKDFSKTIKVPVKITTDTTGEPKIPSITIADAYQTKVVQAALRDYCTTHIRE